MPSVLLGPCADSVRLGGRGGMLFDPSYCVFQPYFLLVAKNTCKTMKLCKTKAKNVLSNLKVGGYLAYTPWDTLLLALVGRGVDRPVFFCINDKILNAVLRPVRIAPLRPKPSTSLS